MSPLSCACHPPRAPARSAARAPRSMVLRPSRHRRPAPRSRRIVRPPGNSSTAWRFASTHARSFGSAFDQETVRDRAAPGHLGQGREHLLRSPEKCEGILIVGEAEGAERRDIERVADVRQPVQARQPPDGEGRGGDRKADRQDERDPQQLAEPLAQQLKQSSRRTAHRRGYGGTLGLGRHENGRLRAKQDPRPDFHAILTTIARPCNDNCQRQ